MKKARITLWLIMLAVDCTSTRRIMGSLTWGPWELVWDSDTSEHTAWVLTMLHSGLYLRLGISLGSWLGGVALSIHNFVYVDVA